MNEKRLGIRHRRPSRLLGAACSLMLLIAVLTPSALAADHVDQQQEVITGAVSVPGSFQQAQTITAGASGVMSRLSVHMANPLSAVNLVVELQGVTAAGDPDGTVMASTALSFGTPANARWVDLSFPQPPTVAAGSRYAIVLKPDDTFAWSKAATAPYAGGQAWTGADTWWTESGDYAFRTYVSQPNAAPVAAAEAYEIDQDHLLTVAAPGLLANDTDAEGQGLTATAAHLPAHGRLSLQPDGSFTYQPDPGFSGSDSFTYTAYDGIHYSEPVTVSLTVHAVNDVPAEPSPDPGSGGKVTGGGWLQDGEGKGHFAFTVASQKDGHLSGNARYSFVNADGHRYQVRVTGWHSLSTDPAAGTAAFSGRALVEQINPETEEAAAAFEGYTMNLSLIDGADSLTIVIRDPNGVLWHQVSGELGGGQVKVHRPER